MKKEKRLKVTTVLSLEQYLQQYDPVTLTALFNSMEASPAWSIFSSFAKVKQREYEIAALDHVKNGLTHQSSYSSGYAKGLEDLQLLIKEFRDTVFGVQHLVENTRPEEVEPVTQFDSSR